MDGVHLPLIRRTPLATIKMSKQTIKKFLCCILMSILYLHYMSNTGSPKPDEYLILQHALLNLLKGLSNCNELFLPKL